MRGPRALAGIMFAAAAALAAGAATAQVPYQIGDDRGNVTVNMGVLESLGPTPTVPEMLRPGTPVAEPGYDSRGGSFAGAEPSRRGAGSGAPSLGVDSAPAPDWLRRPDAPRYAPLPETLGLRSTTAPTLKPPSASSPGASRSAAPPLRAPEPRLPETRAAEPSAPPRAETKAAAARPGAPTPVTAPPPPKPAAPPVTAPPVTTEATPPKPPAPVVEATPKAPPPPAVPIAATPASMREAPAAPETATRVAAAAAGPTTAPATSESASAQGADGDVLRVPFDADQSTLPQSVSGELDALVGRLRKDTSLRVQLLAYADGDDDNANKARRLSLSRALAVRAYLIDKQIQSTRMDVRALGNRTKESPKDRVDVVLVSR